MNILVNAERRDIAQVTLADALLELGYDSPAVATAVNGQFVAREHREGLALQEGDRLEVLAPMQGG